jgi:AraC-like DNA-binding protein
MQKNIPKYEFNSQHKLYRGFEIIPLSRIFEKTDVKSLKPHRLNFYQIIYITKGTGIHTVDFNTIEYTANTIIPVSKDQVQQYDSSTTEAEGFAILFTPDFLITDESGYNYIYDFVIFNHIIGQIAIDADNQIKEHFNSLKGEELNSGKFNNTEFIRNTLKNFLILIERKKRSCTDIVCDQSLTLYQKFIKELNDNISYKLRIGEVCDKLNVTPKQLNAAVKLYTGTTAKNYIEDRLILEMKRLLSYSSYTVKEIAYNIGFEDPTNFTKYFKKRTDQLPNIYRQLKE